MAERLNGVARLADLGRQLLHRRNRLTDHRRALFRALSGLAGLRRGICCVTRDLLGGRAQLVDGSGNAVGAAGLFIGAGHVGIGGVHHLPRNVVQRAAGVGNLTDRFVNALYKTVEGTRQPAEFVLAGHRQTAGKIALSFRDVIQRRTQRYQRLKQVVHQHPQQRDDANQRDQHRRERGIAEVSQAGERLVSVNRQANIPVRTGQPLHRHKGQQSRLAIQ